MFNKKTISTLVIAALMLGSASAVHAANFYKQTTNAFADSKYTKTVELATKSLALDTLSSSQQAQIYNVRGSSYNQLRLDAMEEGNKDKEIEFSQKSYADFNKSISLDSAQYSAFYNRGLLNKFTQQYEPAISDLEKALELWKDSKPETDNEIRTGNAKTIQMGAQAILKRAGFNIKKQLQEARIQLEAQKYGPKLPSFIPSFDRAAPGAELVEKGWLANWERENEQAMDYFEEAANLGNADAMAFLAQGFLKTHGRPKDLEKWMSLMQQSIAKGRVYGYFEIAIQYRTGKNSRKDHDESLRWLKKASAAGVQQADLYIAYNYIYGLSVEKDPVKGSKMIEDMAKNGYVEAQWKMALNYHKGKSPEDGIFYDKDPRKSARWLRKAAKQGHSDAQLSLSDAYRSGKGVLQDYKKSFRWAEQAALQGDPIAQYNVGVMYWKGQGVEQDRRKTKLWWTKSSQWGNTNATKALQSVM